MRDSSSGFIPCLYLLPFQNRNIHAVTWAFGRHDRDFAADCVAGQGVCGFHALEVFMSSQEAFYNVWAFFGGNRAYGVNETSAWVHVGSGPVENIGLRLGDSRNGFRVGAPPGVGITRPRADAGAGGIDEDAVKRGGTERIRGDIRESRMNFFEGVSFRSFFQVSKNSNPYVGRNNVSIGPALFGQSERFASAATAGVPP